MTDLSSINAAPSATTEPNSMIDEILNAHNQYGTEDCSWLVKGKRKFIVGFVFTLLTTFAALSGSRGFFDNLLGGESLLSHSLLYGVITLVFVSATSLLNKSEAQN